MSEMARKIDGVLAQFKDPADLLHAAEKVRDAGFKEWDVHSPFPIHGMDDAMGEKRSILGWLVAGAAFTGVAAGLLMQGWMNAVDYKYVIAGKAFFSYQAFFPVTFALAVLFSVITSVFGMLGLVKVKFHHPIFNSEKIGKSSDDGFFISILSEDPKFNEAETQKFLQEIGGENVELLEEK
jgi:hypothetical protein